MFQGLIGNIGAISDFYVQFFLNFFYLGHLFIKKILVESLELILPHCHKFGKILIALNEFMKLQGKFETSLLYW